MEVHVRIRTVITSLIGLALVLALAAPAAAQGAAASSDRPELGAGISFFRINDIEETGTGFFVDLAKVIRPVGTANLSVVGDFGFHSFDFGEGFGAKTLTIQGGARIGAKVQDRVNVFGQFLIGLGRFSSDDCEGEGCSDTGVAFTPGGGVNFGINEKLNFRAQIDFPIIRFSEEGESFTDKGPRYSFGISMPIGR